MLQQSMDQVEKNRHYIAAAVVDIAPVAAGALYIAVSSVVAVAVGSNAGDRVRAHRLCQWGP